MKTTDRFTFLVLFYLILTIAGSAQAPPSNKFRFRDYFHDINFSERSSDTVFYYPLNERLVDMVKTDSLVYQYYPSGNLLGTGLIMQKECDEIIDTSGRTYKSCEYIRVGKWTVFFDSAVRVIQANLIFNNGVEKQCNYYNSRGNLIQRQFSADGIVTVEYMDSTGLISYKTEHIFINNEKKIISETLFVNGKKKMIVKSTGLKIFILKNFDFFFFLILFLLGIKLITASFIYRKYYQTNSSNAQRFLSNNFLINMKAAFSVYIKPFNRETNNWVRFHNLIAVTMILLLIVFLFAMKD